MADPRWWPKKQKFTWILLGFLRNIWVFQFSKTLIMIFESSMRNSQWREQNGNIITIFIDLALFLETAILDMSFHDSDIRFVISDPKNPCIRSNTRFELIGRKIIVRHLESAILDSEFHKSDIRFVIGDPKNPCIRSNTRFELRQENHCPPS